MVWLLVDIYNKYLEHKKHNNYWGGIYQIVKAGKHPHLDLENEENKEIEEQKDIITNKIDGA